MFKIKDSGKRKDFASGMRRDVDNDKTLYTLVDMPMFKRWAEHMTKGAEKYGKHNWKKACSVMELNRFIDSAFRHFIQWTDGETDEDHAAAVMFNIAAAEHVKQKLGPSWKGLKDYYDTVGEACEEVNNSVADSDDCDDCNNCSLLDSITKSSGQGISDDYYDSWDRGYYYV